MKKIIIEGVSNVFIPNRINSRYTRNGIMMFWLCLAGFLWIFSESSYIPKPWNVLDATYDLIKNGFFRQLLTSTGLCLKALAYSVVISAVISYLSILAAFKPPMELAAKARFLTTVGLTFLFAQITPDATAQKLALLIFGMSVFQVTSFMDVINATTKDELDYARTLKMGDWRGAFEVNVLGKADQMFQTIRQNFAIAWMMLAMVENICRSDGGIGVVLNDQNKHFHYDAIYGIQLLILMLGMFLDFCLGLVKDFFFPYAKLKPQKK